MIRIFRPFDERLSHAIVTLAALLLIASLATGYNPFESISTNRFRFLTEVIFLNTIHVGFTFSMLLTFPEMGAWASHLQKVKLNGVWTRVGISLFSLIGLFVLINVALLKNHSALDWKVSYLFLAVPLFHGVWQMKGLSLIYGKKIEVAFKLDESQRTQLTRAETREARAFQALLFALLLSGCTRSIGDQESSLIHTSLSAALVIELVFAYASVLFIFWNWRTLKWARGRTLKPFFLIRLLIIPMTFFHEGALFFILAIHGLEYLFFTRQLIENSEIDREWKVRFYCIAGAGSLALAAATAYVLFSPPNFATLFIASTLLGLAYTHYILDRDLYRMRESITRAHIGPLLLGRIEDVHR